MRSVGEVLERLEGDPIAVMRGYARDPVEFASDVLRFEAQDWQAGLMRLIADARFGLTDRKRFAVRSGTGVGKTGCVACVILWHLACFPDSKIPCTAPTAPQLKAVLWPEVRKWVNNIPEGLRKHFAYEVKTDTVTFGDNFAVARTARDESPEAFQGFHAKNVLLVADEASGVPNAIYMAGQGVMSTKGAITLLIGNPTRATGYFYDAFHGDSHLYHTLRVGCDESKYVEREYIDDMRRKHGENSYEFRVRVLGEFHLEDAGLVIPRPWIDAAVGRVVDADTDYVVWGFDVSDGRDKSALAKRRGNVLLEATKAWGGLTAEQSVYRVVDYYWATPRALRPKEICVDAIGMGALAARILRDALGEEVTHKRVRVTAVNVAETGARVGDRYVSRRVELWARGREWFESMIVSMPPDDVLASQLSSVEWEVKDTNGKWALIDKKAAGGSPDNADAFLLTFMAREPKTLTHDTGKSMMFWNTGYAQGNASWLAGKEGFNA